MKISVSWKIRFSVNFSINKCSIIHAFFLGGGAATFVTHFCNTWEAGRATITVKRQKVKEFEERRVVSEFYQNFSSRNT